MRDILLFGAFPYVSVSLLLVVSIWRYRANSYGISSLSSQFLESRKLFWGSVPFHLGIVFLFFGHLLGFLFPRQMILWNGSPIRLLIIETTSLVAALLFLVALGSLMVRRLSSRRLRPVTTPLDWVIYFLLLFQVVTGVWIALFHRWGSAWYVTVAVPYLRSLFTFAPNVALIAGVKSWWIKAHILGAFTLIGVFPFSRLMHVLVAPIPYVWRRPQIVVWNRARRSRGEGEVRP
jgi:nitrate reductase gamma subunit